MKKKNLIFYFNLCMLVLILASDIVYMTTDINPYILKTLTSSLFVIDGAFNLTMILLFNKGKESLKTIALFVGLIFAFLGDVLLIDYFIVGAIFFAVGHICFLVYFFLICELTWQDGIIFVLLSIFALLLLLLYKNFDLKGNQVLIIVYAIIISAMLSKALGNLINKPGLTNAILFVGAFLFYFSDLMLLFDLYTNISSAFSYLCLATYYPGEILLSMSIALPYYLSLTNQKAQTPPPTLEAKK